MTTTTFLIICLVVGLALGYPLQRYIERNYD